ncbi:ClpP-like prohead protease/major capsid protein fusion protein [Luteimonas notoginsengisoli]|uniref:ATP-dependent Clp protease proteolytic subunit n=1 Tax=Luteimonas notoginsengisoli TaxID=1578200 RepID=A0ABV7UQV1_9GAMM
MHKSLRHALLFAAMGTILADASAAPGARSLLRIEAKGAGVAEVMVYGTIGESLWSESISARDLVEQIVASTAKTFNVRINSSGGVAADGIAIYNALKAHPARKVVYVDGQACSIASLIAMCGDEVVMFPTSLLMVHAPHAVAGGNASAFREFADTLDTHASAMKEAYVAKTGKGDEVDKLLRDGRDHWYTGAEAVEFGFADRIEAPNAETRAEAASIVALTSYLSAIQQAPAPVAACLRGHITAALSPRVFASLPEVSQQAVIGHIEDSAMKQQYLHILANAGGAQPAASVTNPPAQPPAAPAQAPVVAAAPPQDNGASVLAALRTRNTEILSLAEPHMGNAAVRAYVDQVVAAADPAVTADNVGRHILSLMATGTAPLNGGASVVAGVEQRDLTRAAMLNSIEARAGMTTPTADNPYRGHSLSELARESLVQAGVDVRGRDRMEVVGMAFTHSTSDFPGLLGDAARKAVLKGYEEAVEPIEQITRPVSVPDFKPTNLVGLGAFSDLLVVPEGGEFKQGTFSEQSQAMRLVTYGRLFSITRQAIINDDLGIFGDVPRKLGQAARRTIAKAVFDLLTSNPTLADGKALFHADHGNLMTAAAISTTSVDVMQSAMALQKDADGNIITVPMKSLVVPVALRGLAKTVRESQTEVSGSKNLTTPNTVRDTFDVVASGRLDAVSAAAWYGVADPAFVDGIVIGYLNGNQTPYLEQKEGFTVDGVAWKVRLDAAPAIADYRGLYKNPGA